METCILWLHCCEQPTTCKTAAPWFSLEFIYGSLALYWRGRYVMAITGRRPLSVANVVEASGFRKKTEAKARGNSDLDESADGAGLTGSLEMCSAATWNCV